MGSGAGLSKGACPPGGVSVNAPLAPEEKAWSYVCREFFHRYGVDVSIQGLTPQEREALTAAIKRIHNE
jgi:hypothetical protein